MNAIICFVLLCTTLSSLYAGDWCVEITRVTPQVNITFLDTPAAPIPVSLIQQPFILRLHRSASSRSAWGIDGDTSSALARWILAHLDLTKIPLAVGEVQVSGHCYAKPRLPRTDLFPVERICATRQIVSMTGCILPEDVDIEGFVPVEQEPSFDHRALSQNTRYSDLARRNAIEGRVLIAALICTDGSIADIRIIESDNEILNASAVDAVLATSFTPAVQNGKPIAVWVRIPFMFSLKD